MLPELCGYERRILVQDILSLNAKISVMPLKGFMHEVLN
jgi:hypothetical protein